MKNAFTLTMSHHTIIYMLMNRHIIMSLLTLLPMASMANKIEVVVHRGANALAPENTIVSADSALKYGAAWIEVDVRPSKDGVLFNLHDEKLDRTTNGSGLLAEKSSKEIERLDAGAWFSLQFHGTRIPTIATMLDHLKGRANVFFDVKKGTSVVQLVRLVRKRGYANHSFFWFGDDKMLREFIRLAPEMKIKVNAENIERLKYWQKICHPSYVEIAPKNITNDFIDYCHSNNILVMAACQEDDTSQFQLVLDKGTDLVNLDRPEIFQSVDNGTYPIIHTRDLELNVDGKFLCTVQLQHAIDSMANKRWGTLVVDSGKYLTGSLELKTGIILQMNRGAELLGSANPYDYSPITADAAGDDKRNDNSCRALIVANGASHISILGEGIIDGNGLQLALNADSLHHTGELVDRNYNERRQRPSELVRPKLIFFSNCENVRLDGVRFRNSANWGLSLDRCKNMILENLDIYNRAYWNNDGIDLTDCERVMVRRCQVNSADDGICLKSYHADSGNKDIRITDCDVHSSASAVKFGTGSWGTFQDIEIDNIRIKDTFRSAIAIESVDGAQIDNISVHDIHAVNTGNPIFIRLGNRDGERNGSIRNVVIRRLYCQVPFGRPDEAYDLRGPEVDFFHNPFPSSICGIPGNNIEGVTIEDVEINYPGRATKGMAYMPLWRARDVPEQVDSYPEFSMFGELPAYGFYIRHVHGITFRRIKLSLTDKDFRPAYVLEDVNGATFEQVDPYDIFNVKPRQK